jgi:hypothetical protein
MTKCEKCFCDVLGYNTGEVGQNAYLDCTCSVVKERLILDEAMIEAGLMIRQDEHFHAYMLGKAASEKELVDMLKKMWGHSIELGETDYFNDPQFAKADWAADCAAAAKLIAKYK